MSGKIFWATEKSSGAISITFVAATQKITRGSGSFITNGFVAGDVILTDATLNPGPFTIVSVAALEIVCVSGIVDEGPVTKTVRNGNAVIAGSGHRSKGDKHTFLVWFSAIGTVTALSFMPQGRNGAADVWVDLLGSNRNFSGGELSAKAAYEIILSKLMDEIRIKIVTLTHNGITTIHAEHKNLAN